MPWFKFSRNFDFYPDARKGNVCIAYKAGMVRNVTRECAEKASVVDAGKRVKAPQLRTENLSAIDANLGEITAGDILKGEPNGTSEGR